MFDWLRIILFLICSQVFGVQFWTGWLSISDPFTCCAFSNSNRITWGMFLREKLQFLHSIMLEKTHKIKLFNTVHVLSDSPGWSYWFVGCESGACRSVSIPLFTLLDPVIWLFYWGFLHCQSNHAATPLSLCGVCLPIIFISIIAYDWLTHKFGVVQGCK